MNAVTKKSWHDDFAITIPNGKAGPWSISRFDITKKDSLNFNLGMIMNGSARTVEPGTYTQLRHKTRGVIMSNTPAEIRDHHEPYFKAKGSCLIHGLGLGMITMACLRKAEVEHVTVVEQDADVIKLVAKHITSEFGSHRFEVVHADSLEWKPPRGIRYHMVWHDIWDAITMDNKPDMSKLHRRYGRICDWQGSWGKWDIERMMAEERRSPYYR